MLHNLFMSPFYGRYKVENHKELTSALSKTAEDVEDYYGWNQHCNVQVKMIQDFEFALPYLKPYLFQFSDELGVKLDYAFVDSAWVSCYNKGGFQEVHQHANSDISVVYCMNSGIDFAKFYFIDRHCNDFSDAWIRKVFPTELRDTHFLEVEEGDLLIFPSHLLHGVSVHKSDTVRKTFAFNMNIHSVH